MWNGFDSAAPFGGMKQSGWGREMGMHALEHYTQTKTVWVAALRSRQTMPEVRAELIAIERPRGPRRHQGQDRRLRHRRRAARQVRLARQAEVGARRAASASATSSSAGTSPTSSTTTRRSRAGTPATPTRTPCSILDAPRPSRGSPAPSAILADFRDEHGRRAPGLPALAPAHGHRARRAAWATRAKFRSSSSSSSSARRPHSLHDKGFQKLEPLTPGMFGYSWVREGQNGALMRAHPRRHARIRRRDRGPAHRDRPRRLRSRASATTTACAPPTRPRSSRSR